MTDDEVIRALDLDDAYKVVRVLAEHRVGATELVTDDEGLLYVRKRIPIELANREAWERLSGIDDPHVPQVVCMYELPDVFVVVCRYVMGMTVAELLAREVRLEPYEAAAIAGGVCDALAVLHERGVIHRDVSPGNVVVMPDVLGSGMRPCTRLIDLGVARVANDAAAHDTKPLGTRGFSAPEQYGFAQTDARSDLYSVGRLLLCLAVGHVCDQTALDLTSFTAEELPDPLRDIIQTACAFEPSARYQSAQQMGEALREAERSLSGSDREQSAPVRPEEPAPSDRVESVPGSRGPSGGPESERRDSWASRLRALRAQSPSKRRTWTLVILVLSAVWVALLAAAVIRTWINPSSPQMISGSFGGVALIGGQVGLVWVLLDFAINDRSWRWLILRLAIVVIATLTVMLAMGMIVHAILGLP